jgi:hypothetical protein
MNLPRVYQLLLALPKQRQGILKITDATAEKDVREMANAGLVEATLSDGKEGAFTAINSVTVAGQAFLLSFRGHNCPQVAVARKSATNFIQTPQTWSARCHR